MAPFLFKSTTIVGNCFRQTLGHRQIEKSRKIVFDDIKFLLWIQTIGGQCSRLKMSNEFLGAALLLKKLWNNILPVVNQL